MPVAPNFEKEKKGNEGNSHHSLAYVLTLLLLTPTPSPVTGTAQRKRERDYIGPDSSDEYPGSSHP